MQTAGKAMSVQLRSGRKQQRGIGFIGLIFVFVVVGAVTLLGLKLVPAYLEYMSIKKVLAAMATSEEVKSGTVTEIRKSFDRRAGIDNINVIKPDDLEISKEGGETVVQVSYKQNIPLFTGYTLVIDFAASTADKN